MRLEITRPDDWHLHLRDGRAMADVVGYSARSFARAVIMPNLNPPVTAVDEALEYRERIVAALPEESTFNPLMTLYLTDLTSPQEIEKASGLGEIVGVKLYPAGATTNSEAGVTDICSTDSIRHQSNRLHLDRILARALNGDQEGAMA